MENLETTTPSDLQPPCPVYFKVDWYSYTVNLHEPLEGPDARTHHIINAAIRPTIGAIIDPFSDDGTWRIALAKGFYAYRATHVESSIAVSWGTVNAHLLIELPGRACDYLRKCAAFQPLIELTHDRATRVDCAVDMLTQTSPAEFMRAGYNKRFRSDGFMRSQQGVTAYVGARKSDRFARVYRYDPPHPRAAFLRAETEYHKEAARSLAALISLEGEAAAVAAAHRPFSWAHAEFALETATASPLQARPSDRSGHGELQWLAKAVVPALLKYAANGILDLETWTCELLLKAAQTRSR